MTIIPRKPNTAKYEFSEDEVLDIVLAAIHVHRGMKTYPTYLALIAPPSCGKTSTLNCLNPKPIDALEDGGFERGALIALDRLTPRTLMSGLRGKTGLLERGLENAIIIVRELSSLDTRPQDLTPILGDMRRIFDGEFDVAYGTGKVISWRGRITFIMAGVQHPASLDSELGARILTLRLAAGKISHERILEGHVKQKTKEYYVEQTLKRQTIHPTVELLRHVEEPAQALAILRGTVKRDRTHSVIDAPIVEERFRLVGQLGGLAAGLATVRGCDPFDQEVTDLIWRVVDCTVPPKRMAALETLSARQDLTVGQVVEEMRNKLGLSKTPAGYVLQDLRLLGVLSKGNGRPNSVNLSDEWELIAERMLKSRK